MTDADCANPQLLEWVKEWLDQARDRGSKGVTTYRNAYQALKACPITFEHPSQLQQLKGFGPKLCERLTDQLKKYCQENGLPEPQRPGRNAASGDATDADQDGNQDPDARPKKTRKPKAYVPAFRSGAYALIVGLSDFDEYPSTGMTKADLIELAQPHCDSSMTAPSDPTKFYTAWNSMKTLITKELVFERGRPLRRYALTDEGWEVAKRIKDTVEWKQNSVGSGNDGNQAEKSSTSTNPTTLRTTSNLSAVSEVIEDAPNGPPSPPAKSSDQTAYVGVIQEGSVFDGNDALPTFTPIRLPPGSFSVHLLLDVREVRAKTDRDYMQEELTKQGIKPIMRSLELGDAQWIAKCHDPDALARYGAEGDEVVLDYIAERKRLDDLVASIKDGRFHEQKFRLNKCGAKKVVYVVEDIAMDAAVLARYEESMHSALASTQVVNGYFLKRTQKMDDTIRYLARMTIMLRRMYESQQLNVIPTKVLTAHNYLPLLQQLSETDPGVGYYITYPAFASLASKSDMMTLRDVFLKMLMTTKGITGEKALEIQKRWKTPHEFVKAYEACGEGEAGRKRKHNMVSDHTSQLVGRKKIAKATSVRIAEVWGDA